MSSVPTTSAVIRRFLGIIADDVVRGELEVLEEVIAQYAPFRDAFMSVASGRAAYIIPQTCVALGFEATSGRTISHDELHEVAPFALLCLGLAVGDDLIDERGGTFVDRMTLGWTAMILSHHSYLRIHRGGTPAPFREALLEATDALIDSVTAVAAAEVDYFAREYADDAYLDLARKKTSCYTRHAMQLGCRLAEGSNATHELLSRIGDHLGASLQFLDDALDVTNDSDGTHAATLASVLASRGESLQVVYDLARKEIEHALRLAALLPHSATLSRTLAHAIGFVRFLR